MNRFLLAIFTLTCIFSLAAQDRADQAAHNRAALLLSRIQTAQAKPLEDHRMTNHTLMALSHAHEEFIEEFGQFLDHSHLQRVWQALYSPDVVKTMNGKDAVTNLGDLILQLTNAKKPEAFGYPWHIELVRDNDSLPFCPSPMTNSCSFEHFGQSANGQINNVAMFILRFNPATRQIHHIREVFTNRDK